MITIGFKKLNGNAILPTKAHPTDSGFDLFASEDVLIESKETVIVPTGIAIQLPEGYEAQVRPRSGITSKTKLRVQLGTIDNEYRGEIGIITDNDSNNSHIGAITIDGILYDSFANDGSYFIKRGDKLAQLVIQKLPKVQAVEIDELDTTTRGDNGFGSTGI